MRLFYQIQGDISFHLPSTYYHVLAYWIDKHALENSLFLFPTNVRFNGLFELDELHDILSYINQFATISHAELSATRRTNDIRAYRLHNGLIYEFPYIYHTQRHMQKPLVHFVQTIQEKNFSIHIEQTECSNEELATFEEAMLTIKQQAKKDITNELAILAEFVQTKGFIELLTEQEKIRWDDAKSSVLTVAPFAISETPNDVIATQPHLSTYHYDEKEQRMFTWNNLNFPLHTIFLSASNEPCITLPSGEKTTPCAQCRFRLIQLTRSCNPCTPHLLP